MKKQLILSMVFISVIFTGCIVLSLHPLYTPKQLIKLDALQDQWIGTDSDKSRTWTFEYDTSSKLFNLTTIEEYHHSSDSNPTQSENENLDTTKKFDSTVIWKSDFHAGVIKLKNTYFIDLYPIENLSSNDFNWRETFHGWHYFQAHSFARIKIEGDSLTFGFLNDNWIENISKKESRTIGYEKINGSNIIHGSTNELQKFCIKYAKNDEAFPWGKAFYRVK